MSQTAPSSYILRNMSEVPNPDAISWVPQTLGWQVLALLIVLFAIYKFAIAYCDHQMQSYRTEAKRVLGQHRQSEHLSMVCYDVLKSVHHYLYPNQPQQFNKVWLEYLSQQSLDQSSNLATELGEKWLRSLISQSVALTNVETQQIYSVVSLWIESHTTPLWLREYWSLKNTAQRKLSDVRRTLIHFKRESS